MAAGMVMSVYTCGHVMSVYTVCYVCVCVWGYMCVHAGYYTNMVWAVVCLGASIYEAVYLYF